MGISLIKLGHLEHVDLRREVEEEWGSSFNLKTYHDKVLSFGSPPVQFVRALLLDCDIHVHSIEITSAAMIGSWSILRGQRRGAI
jgi:hypothetical protein